LWEVGNQVGEPHPGKREGGAGGEKENKNDSQQTGEEERRYSDRGSGVVHRRTKPQMRHFVGEERRHLVKRKGLIVEGGSPRVRNQLKKGGKKTL